MYRIQQFLLCDEINTSLTNLYDFNRSNTIDNLKESAEAADASPSPDTAPTRNQYLTPREVARNQDENVAISFRFNGNFHWGIVDERTAADPKQGDQSGDASSNGRQGRLSIMVP